MSTKAQAYVLLAEETAQKITGDYLAWAAFLNTSSRLYKYPIHDQLLIYAQRPDATACAEYDLWNHTMHRYIRRGSKGIALLSPGRYGMGVRYVFDVSDTGTRQNSRDVNLWSLTEDTTEPVRQMLEDEYGVDASMSLVEQIDKIAQQQALTYWQDHSRDIRDSVDGSYLSEYDEFTIGASFRKAAAASISYSIQTRCDLEPELYREDFTEILDWNTPAAVAELGKAVSEITGQVLRQIETTVKRVERSMSHERTDLQAERRLPSSRPGPDRNGAQAAGQVRAAETTIPGGEPSGTVYEADPQRQADGAPAGDRDDRADQTGQPDEPADEAERRDRGTEGAGSDGLGGADEQSEASGRGTDPVGADLRLTNADTLSEQMSFLIPTENEQIQLIDTMEAESVQTPFAFSVPQEVVDEFLRSGGNTTDHRMIVGTDFTKQMSSMAISAHLQRLYHGGNGFVVNGRQYSAWYDEAGIHISIGKQAQHVNMAQVITWEDAAKRIGELMESGQYMGMMELAKAPFNERNRLAESLWYMYRDIAAGNDVFLPSMETVRGGGFPDEMARLSNQLADSQFVSALTAEAEIFLEAYQQNRDIMRFHYHNPAHIVQALKELALPRREYNSLLMEVARPTGFITEDEINASLAHGSSIAGGKGRIYKYFNAFPAHTSKEKADFLKGEYGIGGRSHAVSGSDHSNESHGAKGIKLEKEGCPAVQFSWPQIVSRLEDLMRKDRYLTREEIESLGIEQESEAEAIAEMSLEEEPEPEETDQHEVEQAEDDDLTFDTEYIRERLAENGIVNGEVVDPEALDAAPIVQQALADAEAVKAEAAEPHIYDVGDTVYLDGHAFILEEKDAFGVRLRDPELVYPVFRAESLPRFERLLAEDERNAHLMPSVPQPEQTDEEIRLQTIVLDLTATAEDDRTPVEPAPAAENFRITDDHLGEGGAKTKYQANVEAISTLKIIEAENRPATPDEQEILSRYVGWGGIPQAFDENNASWASEYQQLKDLLTPDEYDAARASTLNAHYTSPTVIRAIYNAVEQMGFTSGNVLEPSCGVGNFFGMLPDSMQNSRLYGVELDSITGRIARQLYPKADITVAGFETTNRKDFYDLAIGNVPFGAYKVQDKAYDRHNFMIHDYFFAKSLDQVRPGGVIAFVTSKGTLDKQSPEVRKYIAQRAELLGAIRLPNTAFKANAGTEVTSDIIFLKKREQPVNIEPDWVHLGQTEDGIPVNAYFAEHPEMILGTMVREDGMYGNANETACVPIEGADLAEQLAEAITHIQGQYQEAELPDITDGKKTKSITADPNVKNYSYTVVNGEVYYRQNSIMVSPELNQTARERVKGMVELRQCVNDLIQAQMDNADDTTITALQQRLNTRYDAFTARYGLINSRGNANAFAEDSSYYLLCSLEVLNEQGELQRKADMFTKRTIRQQTVITHVDTATEALAVSIAEKARVDIPFMEQLTGLDRETLVSDLTGVIFPVPNQSTHTPLYESYVTADEYLSGNVRQKLREARQAAQLDPLYQPNVTALEAAQPKNLDASEIDVRLGATWVDKEFINDFMYETFDTPGYLQRYIKVDFAAYTAEWNINSKNMVSGSNVAAYITYGTNRANAYKILEDTLNLRDIRIYDTVTDADGKERRVLNQKETTLAQQKQEAIKEAFRDWIWRNPARREILVNKYNELFNSTRPREYDGQHITFNGMTPEIQLREHQRNAVAHILYGGNTLLAHEVGAGKSATRS